MHVDDFLSTSSDKFKENVISPLRMKFHCGKELDRSFRYVGLGIEQEDGQIYLQQHDYIEELKQVQSNVSLNELRNAV